MSIHAKMMRAVFGIGAATILLPAAGSAQTPAVFYACYVPSTGTVYRIKEPGLPAECGSTQSKKGASEQHIEFSWTDGSDAIRSGDTAGGDLVGTFPNPTVTKLIGVPLAPAIPQPGHVLTFNGSEWQPQPAGGAASDHGALSGLADDDHTQYLLTDGVRNSTSGFAIVSSGNGPIPVTTPGERLMWSARKSALRAGRVDSDEWDDARTGDYSVAMGWNALAQGNASISLGINTNAVGNGSVALGINSETEEGAVAIGINAHAQGAGSATAIGGDAFAKGHSSTALGHRVTALGDRSLALGSYANAQDYGSIVIADGSSNNFDMLSAGENSFTVRAQRFWFGNHNVVVPTAGRFIETTTGAFLSDGGTWTNSSDVNLKTDFTRVDEEELLRKVSRLDVSAWSYKNEDRAVRHIGPTAQDFHAAFGLGATDKAIATVDADGVSLTAIKALAQRTDDLRQENEQLRTRLDYLEALIQQLGISR